MSVSAGLQCCARRLWLRPQAVKESPQKEGSNPTWTDDEGHWALPVHVREHQVLTLALFDKDNVGNDEIGRWDWHAAYCNSEFS